MNRLLKIILSPILLTTLIYTQTVVAQMHDGPGGGQRRGPPQGAINACKDKSVGASVQFKTPRGNTISAICKMIAVPQGGPNRGGRRQGNNQQQRPGYQR